MQKYLLATRMSVSFKKERFWKAKPASDNSLWSQSTPKWKSWQIRRSCCQLTFCLELIYHEGFHYISEANKGNKDWTTKKTNWSLASKYVMPKMAMLVGNMTQFSSVQLRPTLRDPMDCSMPGLPIHHQLLELVQTHVHWVGDAIQPYHSLLSPSPPAFNLSQHQGLFQWVSSLH